MNKVTNIADYRNKAPVLDIVPENGEILLDTLMKSISIGNEAVAETLWDVFNTYGQIEFWTYISWVYYEELTNISFENKSKIFRIAHIIMYGNKMTPSAYLLCAMNLANRSKNATLITDMQNDLNMNLSPDNIDKLIELGQDVVIAWWMSQWELKIIDTQLSVWTKQYKLF